MTGQAGDTSFLHPGLDPYSADYPDYRDTRLVSAIPLPKVEKVPAVGQDGGGSGGGGGRSTTVITFPKSGRLPYPFRPWQEEGSSSHPWFEVGPSSQPQQQSLQQMNPGGRDGSSTTAASASALLDALVPAPVLDLADAEGDGTANTPPCSFLLEAVQEQLTQTLAHMTTFPPACVARAQERANPFSAIGRNHFSHPDAVALAALDRHPLYLFHHPAWTKNMQDRKSLVFVDVCGGPGGFAEYLLWRGNERRIPVTGYGISPRSTAYHLERFERHCRRDHFHIFSGDTGDPRQISERTAFVEWVRRAGAPVDVVLACGMPQEEASELAEARLQLAKTLVMLGTLAPGGTFLLCIQEATSVLANDLIYLLALLFERIGIRKTHLDPCGPDRVLVCQGRRAGTLPSALQAHLEAVAEQLEHGTIPTRLFTSVTGCTSHADYLAFIRHHNLFATMRRLRKLEEVKGWIYDPFGVDYDRPSLCKSRLGMWKLPIVLRGGL